MQIATTTCKVGYIQEFVSQTNESYEYTANYEFREFTDRTDWYNTSGSWQDNYLIPTMSECKTDFIFDPVIFLIFMGTIVFLMTIGLILNIFRR